MRYIIVNPDEQSNMDLKKILDGYKILDFQGNFTTTKEAENSILEESPGIAFIRMGKAELNAFELVSTIRGLNSFSKIIFLSSEASYAIEAFECGVAGFLLIPFNEEKIKVLLSKVFKREELKEKGE